MSVIKISKVRHLYTSFVRKTTKGNGILSLNCYHFLKHPRLLPNTLGSENYSQVNGYHPSAALYEDDLLKC